MLPSSTWSLASALWRVSRNGILQRPQENQHSCLISDFWFLKHFNKRLFKVVPCYPQACNWLWACGGVRHFRCFPEHVVPILRAVYLHDMVALLGSCSVSTCNGTSGICNGTTVVVPTNRASYLPVWKMPLSYGYLYENGERHAAVSAEIYRAVLREMGLNMFRKFVEICLRHC